MKRIKNSVIFLIIFFSALSSVLSAASRAESGPGEVIGLVRQNCAGYANCFTSLAQWEQNYGGVNFGSCAQGDLACVNKIAVAQIDGAWTQPDTQPVKIDGWTTDATHYIKVYTTTAARHSGKWDKDKYRLEMASPVLIIQEEYVWIDGIQVKHTSSKGSVQTVFLGVNNVNSELKFSNNIFWADFSAMTKSSIGKAFDQKHASVRIAKFWNNIFYDYKSPNAGSGSRAICLQAGSQSVTYLFNNTVYNSGIAFYRSGKGTVIAKNNIAQDCSDGFSGVFSASSDYNISDVATDAPSPSYRSGLATTVAFLNEANDDFHLASTDSGAKDRGTNLSGNAYVVFNNDIDNDTRSLGPSWDIGADEYALVNPVPELLSISPSTIKVGSSDRLVTLTGSNFLTTSSITFNNQAYPATYISATQLKATIPVIDAGAYPVAVINPEPGGGQSAQKTLNVNNPVPVLSSISPLTITAGSPDTMLTLTGSNFLTSSSMTFNNQAYPATYISATQLEVTIPAQALINAGAYAVVVINPEPGGGRSEPISLKVVNPEPVLLSIEPSTINAGSPDTKLTVTGSNFLSMSSVTFNSQAYPATYISVTQLEVTISAQALIAAGTYPVVVINPEPGGGRSQAINLTVNRKTIPVEPLPDGSFGKQYEELIPLDATITSYNPKRFAIITGLVKDKTQNQLPGVIVSLHGLSEYGSAQTDSEGRFSIPVDGGGNITVSYAKQGFITSHRKVDVSWNDIIDVETVTMLSEDPKSTTITFDSNSSTIIIHNSSTVSDESGSRSLAMVFTGDNRAFVTNAQGQEMELSSITVRATEFNTPESMPAKLPSTIAYTYCAELSVDGAKDVRFEKPITAYVDNFLGFAVGEVVPVGYYDREKAVWIAADNGVVVKLLDTNSDGSVDGLDSTGDGAADDLNSDGSFSDEVTGLNNPAEYKPNSTYWRLKISHFSPWDCNWPYGPPLDAIEPNPEAEPITDELENDEEIDCINSFVERRSRVFHEDIPIPGTDIFLHYASNRVKGHKSVITIPASGLTVPESLKSIIVRMRVAGRVFETILPSLPKQKAEFVWDGLDHLGKTIRGYITAQIDIGFVYEFVYYSVSDDFFLAWERVGSSTTNIQGRSPMTLWKHKMAYLIAQSDLAAGFGEGWTLSNHHYLKPSDPNTLIKGDGTVINNNTRILSTVAGNGLPASDRGDGGPATQANIIDPVGVAVDSEGNVYISEYYASRIRKVDSSGIITTIAGQARGYSGDGGPATQARLNFPVGVAVDSEGNLYIADSVNHIIRKVNSSGIITTIAGIGGVPGYSGDGGPATQARLSYPNGVAVDSEGNIYIADSDNNLIRKVDSSGIITTIAGNGIQGYGIPGYSGDGGPATQAMLKGPTGVAVDSEGNIYINDGGNSRIRKVDNSGIITTIAGNGMPGYSGDGGPATQAGVSCRAVAVDKIRNIYISDTANNRIRKVDSSGNISTIAGKGLRGYSGDGGVATQATFYNLSGIAVDSKGDIYICDAGNHRVRKIAPLESFAKYVTIGDIAFAEEGDVGYIMSGIGLHKSTIDLSTGKTLLSFEYNQNNQLISITDRFGNQATIQRNAQGVPISITPPEGLITNLTIDNNNHLTKITHPDNSSYSFSYTPEGLLIDKYDSKGSQFKHLYDIAGKITDVFDPESGHWTYTRAVDTAGNVLTDVRTGEGDLTSYTRSNKSTGEYTILKVNPAGAVSRIIGSADGLSKTTELPCGMKVILGYCLDSEYKYKYLKESIRVSPAGLIQTITGTRTYADTDADGKSDLVTDTTTINGRPWTSVNNILTGEITGTSPLGKTIITNYDVTTLLIQKTVIPGLFPILFSYDTRGRLTGITNGERTTTFAYDAFGNYDYIVTPDQRKFDYTYDVLGRLLTEYRSDGTSITYSYDPNGNLTVLVTPKSIYHTFDYTANNQTKSYTTSLSGSYIYNYNKDRRLMTVTFPSGKAITNTYTNGNLTAITTPEDTITYQYSCCLSLMCGAERGSEAVSYTRDGGYITSDIRSGTLNQAISYTYNNNFQLLTTTYAGTTYNLVYDDDGLLSKAGAYNITRNSANGVIEAIDDAALLFTQSLNGYGELQTSNYTVKTIPFYSCNVTRDLSEHIIQKIENLQGIILTWDYTYDNLGQLTTVKKNSNIVESYTYDPDGNRTLETNELRGISNRAYAYSSEGHLLTAGTDIYQFDKDGFLTGKTTADDKNVTFNYSSRGELLSATLANGTNISYSYDPLGRMIAKKVNGVVVEKYLWANNVTLLAVYDGTNNLITRFDYVNGRLPISMVKGGITYYLFYDQVGSLRAVADNTGAIVKQIDYDSFGAVINDSNPSFGIAFGFAGGLYDIDTGLVRFGARDYDPLIGRWTAKDPIGFDGGDVNLYGYVRNNPVNAIDPKGFAPGDRFQTMDAAGIDAVLFTKAKAAAERKGHPFEREYGGWVCKDTVEDFYTYTPPVPGAEEWTALGTACPTSKTVADYHTHGDDEKRPGAFEEFSDYDKEGYFFGDIRIGYLGTPNKAVKKFDALKAIRTGDYKSITLIPGNRRHK